MEHVRPKGQRFRRLGVHILVGMHSFLVALSLLTVVPVRFGKQPTPDGVARSRLWFPAVGLLLGGLLGGLAWLLSLWPGAPLSAAFLVLAAWVGLTGALHLDGFCDLCDGLFGGHTPEERLRILKDPHLGSFGLAGGVLLLLGKFAVLHDLLYRSPGRAPWLVGGAAVVARCLVLCVAAGARYPRPEGTGKALVEATRGGEGVLFGLVAALSALAACWPDWEKTPLLVGPPLLAVLLLRRLCVRRLDGITGDCLGAAIETAEVIFLLCALATI
jgi:cobalamin 5'-phosphate synthase/cobalamin synthase